MDSLKVCRLVDAQGFHFYLLVVPLIERRNRAVLSSCTQDTRTSEMAISHSYLFFFPFCLIPVCRFNFMCRPAKDRLRRYFRLSSRGQSESDNKLSAPQPSNENSTTQENTTTTETIDESLKIFDTQQKVHSSKYGVTNAKMGKPRLSKSSMANPMSRGRSRSRKRSSIEEFNAKTKKNSNDDIDNNSCSNITASTYCNDNGGISISSGIGIDFDSGGVGGIGGVGGGVGGGGANGNGHGSVDVGGVYNERKPLCSRDSIFGSYSERSINQSRDRLSDAGESLSVRRESSSTYERDMDSIDLLERERSMDTIPTTLAKIEPEPRIEKMRSRHSLARNNSSFERHRKLPDITKIAAPNSPKRTTVQSTAERSPNFPNFVFTHQQHLATEFNSNERCANNRNRTHSTAPMPRNAFDANDSSGFEAFAQSFNSRAPHSRKSSTKGVRERGTRVHSGKYGDSIYSDNL